MAVSSDDLTRRLLNQFKGVPNYEEDDAKGFIESAMQAHGYKPADNIPTKEIDLIFVYAQRESALAIALSTAHYFRYADGDEEIDKRGVSENYRRLAEELQNMYLREKHSVSGSLFSVMHRIDRP